MWVLMESRRPLPGAGREQALPEGARLAGRQPAGRRREAGGGPGVQTAGPAGQGTPFSRHVGMALVPGSVGATRAEAWPWCDPRWAERALALPWIAGDKGGSQERWWGWWHSGQRAARLAGRLSVRAGVGCVCICLCLLVCTRMCICVCVHACTRVCLLT